jgi:hypothetical protein
MLSRAESRQLVRMLCCVFIQAHRLTFQAVDEFIIAIGAKETTADKRCKTSALTLDDEEWTRVRLFCNILQVCVHLMYLLSLLPH